MLKPFSLLFLRLGTGLLLSIWAVVKIMAPDKAVGLSEKYYGGLLSLDALQMPLGVLQFALGLLVVVGLFRKIVYPVQAVVLGVGLLAVGKYILDPLGLYLLTPDTAQLLFFPSLALFAAALVLMAFRDEDTWSLDRK
jgi:uncharacterized membrane protein YphA (DoxX/SURF4 family)